METKGGSARVEIGGVRLLAGEDIVWKKRGTGSILDFPWQSKEKGFI